MNREMVLGHKFSEPEVQTVWEAKSAEYWDYLIGVKDMFPNKYPDNDEVLKKLLLSMVHVNFAIRDIVSACEGFHSTAYSEKMLESYDHGLKTVDDRSAWAAKEIRGVTQMLAMARRTEKIMFEAGIKVQSLLKSEKTFGGSRFDGGN